MRTDFNMRDERGVAPGLTGLTDQVNRYHQQQRTDAALSERLRSNSVMETLNQDKFDHQVGLDDQEAMMAQLKREKMGEFANILSSGTDSDVTGWIAENPLIAKEIGARGQGDFRSEESRKSMLATMYQVLSNPSQENAEAQFASRDKVLDQQGVPMEERQESAELRMLFGTNPEEAIRRTRNYLAANDADNFKKYRSGSGEDVGASGGYVAQEAFEKATKQAWKDAHNGEEIPASKLAEELIGWKRAQAVERYGVVSAEQQARVDKAQALAYNAQIGKDLGIIKNARDVVKARGDIPADEKKAAAKTRMSGNIADVADMLFRLDEMNAIPNVDKSWIDNLISYGKSAEWTQPLQTAVGGEGAAVRESLNTRIPLMLNDIRQSSEMGARGIDTERELTCKSQLSGQPEGIYNPTWLLW